MSNFARYLFDGEMLTTGDIQRRYPAYGISMIRNAVTKMDPPATCRQDLDKWERMAKQRVKLGSSITASLMATQMVINPNSPFAFRAKRIQKERHAKAMARIQAKGEAK